MIQIEKSYLYYKGVVVDEILLQTRNFSMHWLIYFKSHPHGLEFKAKNLKLKVQPKSSTFNISIFTEQICISKLKT